MIRIISNFQNLDQRDATDGSVSHQYIGSMSTFRFLRECSSSDLVILNVDQRRLTLACLLRWALPMLRFKLVSVDLILRAPRNLTGRFRTFLKRILFSRVDRFILYFKDLRGYERFYGITPARTTYVPFKINGWEKLSALPEDVANGSYVLCAGRTLRDVNTFVAAMKEANCPGLLLQQQKELLAQHGTASWADDLPPNLKLVVDRGDQQNTFIDFISRARLVVIPRFRRDIAATGISTYLIAMALHKCVIISKGPGADDVLTDQAVIVPPEDAHALAQQIKLLWDDDNLRSQIASRGREYAQSVRGEKRLLSDVLRVSLLTMEEKRAEGL